MKFLIDVDFFFNRFLYNKVTFQKCDYEAVPLTRFIDDSMITLINNI